MSAVPRDRRLRVSLVVIALVACGRPQHAQPRATFEPFPLRTRSHGVVDAELGTMRVPRRQGRPGGDSITLRFVRLRAVHPTTAAPVVYLAGGPGGSGIDAATGARWPLFDAVRRHADVILLDQRGTGRSDVPPACPPPTAPIWPADRALDADAAYAALRREGERCAAAWRAAGVDLDAYSTRESARDVEALRRALGVPRIDLWGMSYGTHLALAVQRMHPGRIGRMVLMGIEGPDHTLKRPADADRQLERLHAWAAQDSVARALTPDLLGMLRRHLAQLEGAPLRTTVPGLADTLVLGAFDLQLVVAAMLGRAQTSALIPVVLHGLDTGDASLFARLALTVRRAATALQAMPVAMDAASGATRARRLQVAAEERRSVLGRGLNFPWPDLGDATGVADLGDAFRAPVLARVPVLAVSGTLDGRTPVASAEAVLRGFQRPRPVHLILEGAGHDDELWVGSPVVQERIAAFLAGRRVEGGRVATDLLRVPLPPGARR